MWYDEKALEINRERQPNYIGESYRIANAMVIPDGYTTHTYFLYDLDPICKVFEETFFQYVKTSIKASGLYRPPIVHPIHIDEWKKELELDFFQTPPPMGEDDDDLRLRIQCGCNRYFALKELGYDAVECVVIDELLVAQDQAHYSRIDKKWQRPSNLETIKGKGEGVGDKT